MDIDGGFQREHLVDHNVMIFPARKLPFVPGFPATFEYDSVNTKQMWT